MKHISVTSQRCSGIQNVVTFHEVPEIRGDEFAPMYLECDKTYESHSGCKHPWLFVYIGPIGAKLIFAVGLKAKAGARAPQYPSKNPRMRFFRENNPSRKNLKLCSGSFHEDTDSRFVLQFHGNRPPGSG